MGDEKYATALDKLIDAKDLIARLRADLAKAREALELIKAEYDGWVISKCSGNPDTEQVYAQRLASAIFESARATTDRGA